MIQKTPLFPVLLSTCGRLQPRAQPMLFLYNSWSSVRLIRNAINFHQTPAEWLVNTQSESGGWGYLERSVSSDPSNSQFALLALHEAERQGILIPQTTWSQAEAYWASRQVPSGGWNYDSTFGPKPTISMTCAGIASLVVTRGKASQTEQRISNGQVDCCSVTPQRGEIERGMRWLARNIKVGAQASSSAYFYQMYCINELEDSRALDLLVPLIGIEWVANTSLVYKTNSVVWKGSLSHGESNPLIASSFALLFLGKGRRPLAVSKLTPAEKPHNGISIHRIYKT